MHLFHKRQRHKQPTLCLHWSVVTFVVVLRTLWEFRATDPATSICHCPTWPCQTSRISPEQRAGWLPSVKGPEQNRTQAGWAVLARGSPCCWRDMSEHSVHAGVSWALWDSCPGSQSSQEVTESINNWRCIMIMENIAKWRYGCCYETQWGIQAVAWNCTEWTGLFGLHVWHKVIASKYLLFSVLPLPGFLPYTLILPKLWPISFIFCEPTVTLHFFILCCRYFNFRLFNHFAPCLLD